MSMLVQENLFEKKSNNSFSLDVVKAEYIDAQELTWEELFTGYDKIYVITYSSAMSFTWEIVKLFDYAEIIFGSEDVISEQFHKIMAHQKHTIDNIKETTNKSKLNLIERIEEESLKLYVTKDELSHEKTYLLESYDGRYKVITGSANMSNAAFKGYQRENIIYFEGEKAFDWYKIKFVELKDRSTSDITKEALIEDNLEDNIDKLPIFKDIRTKKVIMIEPKKVNSDEIKYTFKLKKIEKKYKNSVSSPDKDGKIRITPDKIRTMKHRIENEKQIEKSQREEYPNLQVDVETKMVTLNDRELDLTPSFEEIKKDVNLFIEYMEGYNKFYGDVIEMQLKYYSFAIWFFTSPFMAILRNTAVRCNRNLLPYPVFGLIYGKSKAGKTSFLETLLKMMIGQKIKMGAPDFTKTYIDGLKRKVNGAPIIVDDLNKTRFNNHAIETIKHDYFGIDESNESFPAVVISANEDVKAVAPEIIRRTVICHVQAGLTNKELMRDRIVRKVQNNIGTALYREFLGQMLEIIPDLIYELNNEESDDAVDILQEASHTFLNIIKTHYDGELPPYIRELTLEDYFGEKVTSSQAIDNIRRAWYSNRKAFNFNKKSGMLTYDAGQTWEADRIVNELPENLEASKTREIIVFDIDKASEFFEINFRKGWGVSRIFSRNK